jgi:hypothetical protein
MKQKMKSKFFWKTIEFLILLLTFFSIIQIFIEDYSVFIGLDNKTVILIRLFGMIFDAVFTVEFLARYIFSAKNKKLNIYFNNNGWSDLISSVPVLVFVSFPILLYITAGIDIPLIIFLCTSITMRNLRFLRLFKLINKIKLIRIVHPQKHVRKISRILLGLMLIFIFAINLLQENGLIYAPIYKEFVFYNIINLIMMLFIIFFTSIFYGFFFKSTISDPVLEMRKGFEEIYYTKPIKIPKKYTEDDIFILANDFNKRWLTAKIRKLKEIKSRGMNLKK